jgi:hypothetical protein
LIKTIVLRCFGILFCSTILISFSGCDSSRSENSQTAQEVNRKSPIAIASVDQDGTYIKVVYGQPYRRGRTIFGDLEPWGEVWRTGANEATEITITEPILMGDQALRAGTYALFTIPNPDSLTVILNHELGQWGAFEYNPDRDYKRMKFPVKNLESPVEAFTIEFTEPEFSMTTMKLKWDVVQVNIPIRFYGE